MRRSFTGRWMLPSATKVSSFHPSIILIFFRSINTSVAGHSFDWQGKGGASLYFFFTFNGKKMKIWFGAYRFRVDAQVNTQLWKKKAELNFKSPRGDFGTAKSPRWDSLATIEQVKTGEWWRNEKMENVIASRCDDDDGDATRRVSFWRGRGGAPSVPFTADRWTFFWCFWRFLMRPMTFPVAGKKKRTKRATPPPRDCGAVKRPLPFKLTTSLISTFSKGGNGSGYRFTRSLSSLFLYETLFWLFNWFALKFIQIYANECNFVGKIRKLIFKKIPKIWNFILKISNIF